MRVFIFLAALAALVCSCGPMRAADADLDLLEQQAWRDAVDAVADAVVQIRTVGGLDRVGKTLLAQGPTTGLIVSADGYIVSSAFNFSGQPTSILVRLASGEQLPAELVAHDRSRMLVLLKVNADAPLPLVEPVPQSEMRVAQWSIAVGRTFSSERVAVTVGIVSALNRMYGRVLQTDASVSVANYGGPLVDTQGRVFGVLTPMSPQAAQDPESQDLAGAEFYDSGIGFAVPLEHILDVLERWKAGDDLLPGKLGVGLASGPAPLTPPKITTVWPGSPASAAGWQAEDLILAIAGTPIETQADLRYQVVPRYAGDTLEVTIRRGDEELASVITLTGSLDSYRAPFLGIVPQRANQGEGVKVRAVWPGSPAAQLGIQAGDRLTQIEDIQIKSLDDAFQAMKSHHPADTVELVLQRGQEQLKPKAELAELPSEIAPADLFASSDQEDSSSPDAAEDEKLQSLVLPIFAQETKYYKPLLVEGQQPGLLIWLSRGNQEQDQQLFRAWQDLCRQDGLILVIAHPGDQSGWSSDDLEYLAKLTLMLRSRWDADSRRIVLGGQGKAGQLAAALALKKREEFSGVVAVDAPLPRTLRIPENQPGRQVALLAVETPGSTFAPLIRRDLTELRKAGYAASQFSRPVNTGQVDSLDKLTRATIARWIDTLDRF